MQLVFRIRAIFRVVFAIALERRLAHFGSRSAEHTRRRDPARLACKLPATTTDFAAAVAKLIGVPLLIQVFDAIGLGQWFRIFTALVEIIGVIGLVTPGLAAFGALCLCATMFSPC